MQRVQLAIQRVALGGQQAQGGKLGCRAKQLGVGELELLLRPGHVQLLIFQAFDGPLGQQVVERGAQGTALGIAASSQVAEVGQGGFELSFRLVFHRLVVVPHDGCAQAAHVPGGEASTTIGGLLLIGGGLSTGRTLVEAVAVLVEIIGVLLGQQRMQNGPGRKSGRFQLCFEQRDGFFVGIFLLCLQQPDFIEQRPHVSGAVAALFGLLINGFHQRRGRGGLVLAQQRVNLLPTGGVGAGRYGGSRVGAENHGHQQAEEQEQAHGREDRRVS